MLPEAIGPNGPEWPGQFAGFLGSGHDPYRVSIPGSPGFSPGALALNRSLTPEGVSARRSLLDQLSHGARALEKVAATTSIDPHYFKAFDVISSPPAQKAIDIAIDAEATRDRYGRQNVGQSCMLARRLVEAGGRLVQLNWLRSNIGGPGGPDYDTRTHHLLRPATSSIRPRTKPS